MIFTESFYFFVLLFLKALKLIFYLGCYKEYESNLQMPWSEWILFFGYLLASVSSFQKSWYDTRFSLILCIAFKEDISGEYLNKKYSMASKVKVTRKGRLRIRSKSKRVPTAYDLVYLEKSPDYCKRNITIGSTGNI